MNILITVLIGAVAGWLAGIIMKSKSAGVLYNIILGIVGAYVGSWLLGILGIPTGTCIISATISATIGAIVVIVIARLLRKK